LGRIRLGGRREEFLKDRCVLQGRVFEFEQRVAKQYLGEGGPTVQGGICELFHGGSQLFTEKLSGKKLRLKKENEYLKNELFWRRRTP